MIDSGKPEAYSKYFK